jgi:hypothetical protein
MRILPPRRDPNETRATTRGEDGGCANVARIAQPTANGAVG